MTSKAVFLEINTLIATVRQQQAQIGTLITRIEALEAEAAKRKGGRPRKIKTDG